MENNKSFDSGIDLLKSYMIDNNIITLLDMYSLAFYGHIKTMSDINKFIQDEPFFETQTPFYIYDSAWIDNRYKWYLKDEHAKAEYEKNKMIDSLKNVIEEKDNNSKRKI